MVLVIVKQVEVLEKGNRLIGDIQGLKKGTKSFPEFIL
jgi:hypothetical protein